MSALIHTSPLPDVEIPEVPITAYVMRRAADLADQLAFVEGMSGATLTFAELDDAIRRHAGALVASGLGLGEVVGVMAPNCPEYAIAFHGTVMAGGTVTTINPTYGAEEVRFQLIDAGATRLVAAGPFLDVASEAAEGTDVTEVVDLAQLAMGDRLDAQVEIDTATHVAVLPYSSGTTGLPKGVMLTHRNLVANLAQCQHALQYGADEVALAVLPFFHIYGMQVLMNGLLADGVTVVTMPRFDLEVALKLVETHRVTRFYAVPPIVLALAKHPLVDAHDLSSVKQVFSGAAPLGADLAQEAAARIGAEVVQGYGMTELSPVTHATPPGDFKPGTVGVTVSNTECRLVDSDTGEDQPVGAEGELWVRGPQVMAGYLNNEEATAATIDGDGWLHTGDVAVIDEDGHVSIVDRVKELIKYKGFQVPPAELEALLVAHPAIADVAVIGVPDTEAGELPKAFVVVAPGAELSEDEVKAHVADHVATYKQVRIVEFTDEIPKSASGKILRRLLREQS